MRPKRRLNRILHYDCGLNIIRLLLRECYDRAILLNDQPSIAVGNPQHLRGSFKCQRIENTLDPVRGRGIWVPLILEPVQPERVDESDSWASTDWASTEKGKPMLTPKNKQTTKRLINLTSLPRNV